MEKKCSTCGEIKLLNQFAKNKTKKDGLQSNCKQCNNKIQIEYRTKKKKETPNQPRMAAVTKRDYCTAYRLLEQMGYDLTQDIHQQFIDKHNIQTYRTRHKKNVRKYQPSDCINKKQ